MPTYILSNHHSSRPVETVFEKVSEYTLTPCEIIISHKSTSGIKENRPMLWYQGRSHIATNALWGLDNRIIPKGQQLNHLCHNSRCVNLNHLYVGTQQENIQDMMTVGHHPSQQEGFIPPQLGVPHTDETKGKISKANKGKKGLIGSDNPNSKLTWDQVKEIKNLLLQGFSLKKIAKRFNVGTCTIRNIKIGKLWKSNEETD